MRSFFFNWCTFLVGSCSDITDRQYVVLSGKVMSGRSRKTKHGVALSGVGFSFKIVTVLTNFVPFYIILIAPII